MQQSFYGFTLTAAVLVAVSGCSANAARGRFSNEYSCPSDQVEVVDLGANSYRVSGCGRQAIYACAGGGGERVCVRETSGGEAPPTPDRAPRAAAEPRAQPAPSQPSTARSDRWTLGRVRFATGRAGNEPALQLRVDGTYDATLTFVPARDREMVLVQLGAPPAAQGDCDGAAVSVGSESVALERAGGPLEYRVALDALGALPDGYFRFELCGTTTELVSTESNGVRRFLSDAVTLRNMQQDREASGPTAGGGEGAVREWIEARRQVILACVPEGPVVIAVVEAGANGATFSLRPPHAGTPEERCARAAVGAPPATSSTVIHALGRE